MKTLIVTSDRFAGETKHKKTEEGDKGRATTVWGMTNNGSAAWNEASDVDGGYFHYYYWSKRKKTWMQCHIYSTNDLHISLTITSADHYKF